MNEIDTVYDFSRLSVTVSCHLDLVDCSKNEHGNSSAEKVQP